MITITASANRYETAPIVERGGQVWLECAPDVRVLLCATVNLHAVIKTLQAIELADSIARAEDRLWEHQQ